MKIKLLTAAAVLTASAMLVSCSFTGKSKDNDAQINPEISAPAKGQAELLAEQVAEAVKEDIKNSGSDRLRECFASGTDISALEEITHMSGYIGDTDNDAVKDVISYAAGNAVKLSAVEDSSGTDTEESVLIEYPDISALKDIKPETVGEKFIKVFGLNGIKELGGSVKELMNGDLGADQEKIKKLIAELCAQQPDKTKELLEEILDELPKKVLSAPVSRDDNGEFKLGALSDAQIYKPVQ